MSETKPLLVQYNNNKGLRFHRGDNLNFEPLASEYSREAFFNFYIKLYW